MIKIDRAFLVLFILAFLVIAIFSFYYYHKTVQYDDSISWVDFRVYYYAGFRLEIPGDVYEINDGYFIYKYSPIFALVMSVLKFCNSTPAQALIVWYVILFVSFVISLYLVKEILFYPRIRVGICFFDIVPFLFIFRYLILINFTSSYTPSHWPLYVKIYDAILLYALTPFYVLNLLCMQRKAAEGKYLAIMLLAVLFVLRFLALNIDRAQVNIVILLLILFFVYYLMNKKYVAAGIYLGIAAIFKLTPIIFLLYLIVKKKFKAAFSCTLTFATLLFIPSFRLGIRRTTELIGDWINVLKMTLPSEYLQHKNQSMMAMISRFFSSGSDISAIKLNNTHLAVLIALMYVLFLVVLIYVITNKRRRLNDEREVLFDLSLFFIAMVILSPVGTKTTFIYTILPIALLIEEAFRRNLKNRFINTGLLTYVSLIYLNSSDVIGDFSTVLHKYSLMTFCVLLLFVLTIYSKDTHSIFS